MPVIKHGKGRCNYDRVELGGPFFTLSPSPPSALFFLHVPLEARGQKRGDDTAVRINYKFSASPSNLTQQQQDLAKGKSIKVYIAS